MKQKILKAINDFKLLDGVNNVTVALSGGADSMALLYSLFVLSREMNFTLDAAHLNHMIRGEEADRDEKFVIKECKKLGVKLFTRSVDVPKIAQDRHLSLETAARDVRYDFLNEVSVGVVATAHTASDNLETMLFNLARGSATKGLSGIPISRNKFIRPLIFCSRQDIEDYCEKNGIEYVTDSTNLCDDYSRNKIRHKIIPILKQINPSVEFSSLRAALLLKEDDEFLSLMAEEYFYKNYDEALKTLDVSEFENISPAIAKRVIRLFANKINSELSLDYEHTNKIYKSVFENGKVTLPKNLYAETKKNILSIKSNCINLQNDIEFIVEINQSENNLFLNSKKINNLFLKNSIDCDKIIGKLVLRTRQDGDSIRLKNRNCSKTLKKLYNECSIERDIREKLPLLADDKGVVWIYSIGVANRCAVNENSKNIFIINTKQTQNIKTEEL